jgi:hypothetical protein
MTITPRRAAAGLAAAGVLTLAGAAPAVAFGPSGNGPAVVACLGPNLDGSGGAVGSQRARGVEAGGGPKSSVQDGPTNCDHFWQIIGAIGPGSHTGP